MFDQIRHHFITTLVVMSHKSNTCSVFASQLCLHATLVPVSPYLCDHLNANYRDMEKSIAFM